MLLLVLINNECIFYWCKYKIDLNDLKLIFLTTESSWAFWMVVCPFKINKIFCCYLHWLFNCRRRVSFLLCLVISSHVNHKLYFNFEGIWKTFFFLSLEWTGGPEGSRFLKITSSGVFLINPINSSPGFCCHRHNFGFFFF